MSEPSEEAFFFGFALNDEEIYIMSSMPDRLRKHFAALEVRLSKMEEKYFNAVKDNAEVARINTDYLVELVDLRKRVEATERVLYNAINVGVAHAFLNLDDDSRRARVLTQEEIAVEEQT